VAIEAIRGFSPIRSTAPIDSIPDEHIEVSTSRGLMDIEDRLYSSFETKETPRTRPTLPLGIKLARFLDDQESIASQGIDLSTKRVRASQAALAKTNATIMEQIDARKSKESEVSLWGMLSDVANYLTGASSLITGGLLCATGTPFGVISGGMLIIGGISSITSLCLHNFGADPHLAGTFAVLGAGLSLMGGILSWNEIVNHLPRAITTLSNCALGVMNSVSMIGEGVSKSSLATIDKLLVEKKEAARKSKEEINLSKEDMQATVRQLTTITKQIKESLKALEDAKLQALRGR